MTDDRQYRHYDIECPVHGDLGQVIGAYDASIVLDRHRRFDICARAVANPARLLRQRERFTDEQGGQKAETAALLPLSPTGAEERAARDDLRAAL